MMIKLIKKNLIQIILDHHYTLISLIQMYNYIRTIYFKNDISLYNQKDGIWNNIELRSKDKFHPRLNSTIFAGKEGSFYVFGGEGNKNGHQKFGKYTFKDLGTLIF